MASDMFLNIESNKVKGESRDKDHKESIRILGWTWGMSSSGGMHEGAGSGKSSVQDLSITKYIDRATPELQKALCEGTRFKDAKLVMRTTGGTPLEYHVIAMENVLITSISHGGTPNEDRPTESISLNFEKFKVKYQPQKQDGTKDGGVVEMGWNIGQNAAY